MSINTTLKAAGAACALLVILAFTPLAEGDPGTWQDTVGNVVWSGIFLTGAIAIVLGIVALTRRRAE